MEVEMYTFEAVYEAEAYRLTRQQDALAYRRGHNPVLAVQPVAFLITLLAGLFR